LSLVLNSPKYLETRVGAIAIHNRKSPFTLHSTTHSFSTKRKRNVCVKFIFWFIIPNRIEALTRVTPQQ